MAAAPGPGKVGCIRKGATGVAACKKAGVAVRFAVRRLVDSANAAAGKSRQFFERLDWTVIEKGDKYEPRRMGFHISTDFATRIQKWIDQGRPSE